MLPGKLVVLRAIEKDDLEQIKEWLGEPDLLHALGARPIPLASIDPDKLPEQFRLRDGRALAIVSKDKHMLGLVAFGNIHEHNRTASILVLIGDRGEWNRGYGSDALRTAVRFAFEDLNLNCVEAYIPEFNTRGQHAFEKVGFLVEGRLRHRFYGRGRYWDMVIVSALREGWTGERQAAPAEGAGTTAAPAGQAQSGYGNWNANPATPPPGSPADGQETSSQGYPWAGRAADAPAPESAS